jgi:uncharacterized protein HemX
MTMNRLFNPLKGEITTGDEANEPWAPSAVDAFKAKRRAARTVSRRVVTIMVGLVLVVLALGCGVACWVLWLGKLVMK